MTLSLEVTFLTQDTEEFIQHVHVHALTIEEKMKQTHPPVSDEEWRTLTFQILEHLTQILRVQAERASSKGGGFAEQQYRALHYLLVAYADEVFLRRPWPGRAVWEDHLLEMTFFNTHQAGERFFEDVDALVRQGGQASQEMVRLNLWMLNLGFQGRFVEDTSSLERYRAKLHQLLHTLWVPDTAVRVLFPQAYQHTVDRGDRVMLPNPGAWRKVYAAFMLFVLISGALISLKMMRPLDHLLPHLLTLMEGV